MKRSVNVCCIPAFVKQKSPFLLILLLGLSFAGFGQQYAEWADKGTLEWVSSTLNNTRSNYFESEVLPLVYQTGSLAAGATSQTFTINFDNYDAPQNAGGFAYVTTYNTSRHPTSFLTTTPSEDNSFTKTYNSFLNGGDFSFFTANADVTAISLNIETASNGSKTGHLTVTFDYTGSVAGTAEVYFGLYISKRNTLGAGTLGASHYPGGSLQTNLDIGGTGSLGFTSSGIIEGLISGMKFSDTNKDGSKAGTELGLPNWIIYIDANNNDVLDAGEQSSTTDANGNYVFSVIPGTYIVREQNQVSWQQTYPAPSGGVSGANTVTITTLAPQATDQDFGNFTCATPTPTISAGGATTFCSGSSVVLSSSSATGNQWYKDNVAITTDATGQTYTVTLSGDYKVTVTLLGCPASSTTTTVSVVAQPVAPTLATKAPNLTTVCTGTTVSATFTAGSGGVGCSDSYQYSTDNGTTYNSYTPGAAISTTGSTGVIIQGQRGGCTSGAGCTGTGWTTLASWDVVAQPVGPTLDAKAPNLTTVCDGTTVSATFTAGSGGAGCTDSYQYSTNNGSSYSAYTPGTAINTTGSTGVIIQGRRAGCTSGAGCTGTSWVTLASWTVVAQPSAPTLNTKTPNVSSVCEGTTVSATFTAGSGGFGCTDSYQYSTNNGTSYSAYTPGTSISTTGSTGVIIQGQRAGCTAGAGCNGTGWVTLASWSINQYPVIPSITPKTVQYSDPVSSSITVMDDGAGSALNASTEYKLSTAGSYTTGLPNGLSLTQATAGTHSQTFTISGTANVAPGTYLIKITVSDGNCPSVGTLTITVTQEKACGEYDGLYFFNSSSTGVIAPVNLQLIVTQDADGSLGNLANATVQFTITPQGPGSTQTLSGSFSSTSVDGSTGVFTASWTPPSLSSNTPSMTYLIGWTIGNYFSNNSTTYGCDNDTYITFSMPSNDFVTGGGFIVQSNTGGSKGGTENNGLKANFGFNVKWTKSLTNLKGNWNNIIRRMEGGQLVQYQVKSSSPSNLVITKLSTTSYRADFLFNQANLQKLDGSWSDGNATVNVTVFDNAEPGAGVDQILIVVKDKYGNTWYNSDVSAIAAIMPTSNYVTIPVITKGNIQVHTSSSTKRVEQAQEIITSTIDMRAYPNPSNSQFKVQLISNVVTQPIQVRVSDILGRTLEMYTNLSAGQTIQLGQKFNSGIYFVEMTQGDLRKQLKLTKQ